MFLKILIEQYLEKQGEMDLTHNGYGEDDMLKDLAVNRLNIKHIDYHKTVLAKNLQKKGKITILDNGDLVLGKKKAQKTVAPSSEQGSLF